MSPRVLPFALPELPRRSRGGPPREPRPPKPWWVGPSGAVVWGTHGNGPQTCKGVGAGTHVVPGAMALLCMCGHLPGMCGHLLRIKLQQ